MTQSGGINDDLAIARAALLRAKIELLRQLAGLPAWQAWQQLREREQNGDPVRSIDDTNLKARLIARLDDSVPGWQHIAGIEAALSALGAASPTDARADDAGRQREQRDADPSPPQAVPTPENPTDPMVATTARPSHPRLGVRLDAMDVLQKIRSIEPTSAGPRARAPPRASVRPPQLPSQRPAEKQNPQPLGGDERPFVPPPWSNDRNAEATNPPEPDASASAAAAWPSESARTAVASQSALESAARVQEIEAKLAQMIAEAPRTRSTSTGPAPDGPASRQRLRPESSPSEPYRDGGWIESRFGEAEVEIIVTSDDDGAADAVTDSERPTKLAATVAATGTPARASRDESFDTETAAMRADEASVEIVQFDDPPTAKPPRG